MDFTAFLSQFSFLQILTLVVLVLAAGVYIFIEVTKKGFSFKGLVINPKQKTQTPIGNPDVLLLLEALKIKDDLATIDHTVYQKQKRSARQAVNRARDLHLKAFRQEVYHSNNGSPEKEKAYHSDNDYLYYMLLLEQMYTVVFSRMMDSFESNGLTTLKHPYEYAEEQANIAIEEGVNKVLNPFYPGIRNIPRSTHDQIFNYTRPQIVEVLCDSYTNAVKVAKSGQSKKEEFKGFLFDKVDNMQGISRDQISSLFTNISPDDILNP